MFKKGLILSFSIIIVLLGVIINAEEKTPNRIIITKLIDQVNFSSWLKRSFRISPDKNYTAYVATVCNKMMVVIDGKKEKPHDEILEGTPIFSPDSNSIAYAVRDGNEWFVVVNGKEGKRYDGIMEGVLTFSSDSQHFAYAAKSGNGWFVVFDGKEGIKYDSNTFITDNSIVIDSSDSLHYLTVTGRNIYYVQEKID
jgi:hypothetical protein